MIKIKAWIVASVFVVTDCKGRQYFQKRLSVHAEGGSTYEGGLPLGGGAAQSPPVLTSSGGHCSGRYASYWNAF